MMMSRPKSWSKDATNKLSIVRLGFWDLLASAAPVNTWLTRSHALHHVPGSGLELSPLYRSFTLKRDFRDRHPGWIMHMPGCQELGKVLVWDPFRGLGALSNSEVNVVLRIKTLQRAQQIHLPFCSRHFAGRYPIYYTSLGLHVLPVVLSLIICPSRMRRR